ncbi:MAG: hypothetical protein ACI87W_000520 [Halieaceae bacterium]|jgi:hypothetical protein
MLIDLPFALYVSQTPSLIVLQRILHPPMPPMWKQTTA